MRIVDAPVHDLPSLVHRDHAVGLRREDHRAQRAPVAEREERLARRAVVQLDASGGVRGDEALVAARRADGDHGRAVRLELVDAREGGRAARRRRHHLPAGDGARRVRRHQRALSDQERERGDGRGADRRRLHNRRGAAIAHVVAHELAARGADDEIVAAAIEAQRDDVTVDGNAQRLHRFLAARPADQRLLLHHRLHDQVVRSHLRHRHRSRVRRGDRQAQDRALALEIEDDWGGERGFDGHGPPVTLEADLDLHLERDHAAVGGADGVAVESVRGHRRHPRALEAGDRQRRRPRHCRLERNELNGAVGRDHRCGFAVLVDAQAGARRGRGPRREALQRDDARRPEQRPHLGRDDEEDGEDRRDDHDAAEHDRAGGEAIEEDPSAGARPADDERAGRSPRPARGESVGVDRHATGSCSALPSRWSRGSGSSRP